METDVRRPDDFNDRIKNVNDRISSYLIFDVPDVKNAQFKILSEGRSICKKETDIPTTQNIKSKFDECKKEVLKYDSCYVLYDFHYLNFNNEHRNKLLLFSYLNDKTCPVLKKVFYSCNSMKIMNDIHASLYISIHSDQEFTYENLQDICRNRTRN